MRVSAISPFARLRIGVHLDYSIAHGSASMPPAYAAPEIRPLAPEHSAGSASDVSLGPPSANGHCRRYRVWLWARGYVRARSTPPQFWLLQSTPPLPLPSACHRNWKRRLSAQPVPEAARQLGMFLGKIQAASAPAEGAQSPRCPHRSRTVRGQFQARGAARNSIETMT